ncbi:hypothetical protein BKA65DRAFT_485237 [Rhexocercosporidium sp. MPI-PUGE-AT-0058]|nr:hypothetical protein BKA65DRAFT_485237 [Rhexocercosporidium sp. MPI-PUGE-AT-0058]
MSPSISGDAQIAEPISDPQAILQILKEELPDPNQDCSIQIYTQFLLFKKLPLELRLMIWKHCLPKGRRVWLRYPCSQPLKSIRSPPITSRINRESREETFKKYRQLQHSWPPPFECLALERYSFWDDERDTLRVDVRTIITFTNDLTKLWYTFFAFWDSNTESLKHIRNIEIQDFDMFLTSFFDMVPDIKDRCASFISKLGDLREIGLLLNLPRRGPPITADTQAGKDRIRWLTDIFEEKRKVDSSVQVPKLYFSKLPDR